MTIAGVIFEPAFENSSGDHFHFRRLFPYHRYPPFHFDKLSQPTFASLPSRGKMG